MDTWKSDLLFKLNQSLSKSINIHFWNIFIKIIIYRVIIVIQQLRYIIYHTRIHNIEDVNRIRFSLTFCVF